MTRWARPDNFGHPVRNPLLRKHFVYRAYDENGDLLYLGCSLDLDARMKAHKVSSEWYELMRTLRIAGPFNYEVARELEAAGLKAERPLYGFHPDRRSLAAISRRVFDRKFASLTEGTWSERVHIASEHAAAVSGYPGNREPLRMNDLTVPAALRAEAADERRSA